MKVSADKGQPEIFYSLQGEGKNLGQPSIFIRLSLCNLYCIWCDTDYTWNWEGTAYPHVNDSKPDYQKFKKEEQIIESTIDEIVQHVQQYPCKNIVLTGGEPMVQHKELVKLMSALPGYHFEIETNGTIIPGEPFQKAIDQYNVSAKLSNSQVKHIDRIKPEALEFFAQSGKANFKFVVADEQDLSEVMKLIGDYQIQHQDVFLMPEGTTIEQLNEKQSWLSDVCLKYGFNYTDRMHVRLFGSKRGVWLGCMMYDCMVYNDFNWLY